MDPILMFLDDPSDTSEFHPIFPDDDDEELLLALAFEDEHRSRPKNLNYLDCTVSRYNEKEFREHFRVSRKVAEFLAERFEGSDSFNYQCGPYGKKLNSYEQVLIFLWFCGHQTVCYRDVADRFNVTISSLFRVNLRMIYFISGLSDEFIRWPDSHEQPIIEAAFRAKGFPGVIGAIDGTHIKLDRPAIDPDSYCNRKKYFSLQMQAVCDHRMKFRDVFIGFPGSVHDARVFHRSDLGQNLREMCGENVLVGDTAYPCLRNLMTPFKDLGQLTRSHKAFNKQLSSCRITIEHCFGLWKQRFRQLYHCKLRSIRNIAHFVRACCVLHNLALDDDPSYFVDSSLDDVEAHSREEVGDGMVDEEAPDTREGVAYRQYLLQALR